MTEPTMWSLAASIATVTTTLVALIALLWTARSLRASTRASDLNSLFLMTGQIAAAEARMFASSSDAEQRKIELNNYLNMLETLAAAINGSLFGPVSTKIAADRLCNDIAILMANDSSRERIEQAVSSPETFSEMSTFHRKNRERIMAGTSARISDQE